MLLAFVFTIESTVVVCTPKPVLVKDVSLNVEDVLGVRDNIYEDMTKVYWVDPVVSGIEPLRVTVTVDPELVHVVPIVPVVVDRLHLIVDDNVI